MSRVAYVASALLACSSWGIVCPRAAAQADATTIEGEGEIEGGESEGEGEVEPNTSSPGIPTPTDAARAFTTSAPHPGSRHLYLRIAMPSPTTGHPAARDTEAAPVAQPPRVPLSQLVLYAFVGELIGGAIGGTVGLLGGLLQTCRANEGWLSGYTCAAGVGFAGAAGLFVGASVGAPIALLASGDHAGAHGNAWAGLGGAVLGLGAGAGLFGGLDASLDQATWTLAVGGLTSMVLTMFLSAVFYDLGRPPRVTSTASGVSVSIDF